MSDEETAPGTRLPYSSAETEAYKTAATANKQMSRDVDSTNAQQGEESKASANDEQKAQQQAAGQPENTPPAPRQV